MDPSLWTRRHPLPQLRRPSSPTPTPGCNAATILNNRTCHDIFIHQGMAALLPQHGRPFSSSGASLPPIPYLF
uniref:Uncharacterized protein n=1 Tax=Arundo donax TaxID=35708 RepID=A0A0A9B250_ARUDO